MGQGFCGCGIAVRVEDSLFAYRTCEEISHRYSKPLVHHDTVYHICDDRHMVVDIGNSWTKVTHKLKIEIILSIELFVYIIEICGILDNIKKKISVKIFRTEQKPIVISILNHGNILSSR